MTSTTTQEAMSDLALRRSLKSKQHRVVALEKVIKGFQAGLEGFRDNFDLGDEEVLPAYWESQYLDDEDKRIIAEIVAYSERR